MARFFAGTSGWAYPSWKPEFYPEKLAQKKFLGHYATRLNTVEVNFTFRQLVKESTIQNWMEQSPLHFRFGVKAHQVITHIKRLKATEEFLPRFLATIEPLAAANKLGSVLFQLPPNLKMDATLLKDFLAILPRILEHGCIYFRHLKCPHRKEEALAEVRALAWKWFARLAERGKDPSTFVSALATYAARAVRCGRRVCGHERVKEVLSPVAQRRHGSAVESG